MAEAEVAVLTNIGDMIDLAIGTPEMGVVDFCMLQTVLHCMAQQLCLHDKNVELRGSVAHMPLGTGKELVHTITVNEYLVETDGKDSTPRQLKKHEKKSQKSDEPDTLLIVERVKKEGLDRGKREYTKLAPLPAAPSVPLVSSMSVAPPRLSMPVPPSVEKLSLVTLSKFNLLEDIVDDLKNRVYGSMPKNEEILEEVRSQTNMKSITDMWKSLNVSSRLEAAEEGIAKLSSLVQDLIGESAALQDAVKYREAGPREVATPAPPASTPELAAIQAHLQRLRDDLDRLNNTFYTTMQQMQAGLEAPPVSQAALPPPEPLPVVSTIVTRRPSNTTAEILERLVILEKRLQHCCDNVGKNDGTVQDQMNNFQDQLEHLMKQVAGLTEDLAAGKLSPDLIKDLQGLMQLFQTVQEMQEQLKLVHATALQLAAEKEDRQYHMNALLEQIEILKTIKLDREDMVEAMADKADLRMLARKVSHDQFEMACDDLAKGLEHAIGKLNIQEALWQQALDDIQREIETKLDKMELSPVKEFFNNKLRQLQEHLKQLASLRREAEAAGTKRKLLRDVNCISCDAQAMMPMESTVVVPSKPLPANLSMKPYLSYELDAIRKAQATNMPQRNMHDWETIDKQMSHPKQPQRVRSETDKHICNRYCGGSHTVTTPAQRVARLGHFIKQWGPDVVPLSSGFATGDDGRMYKVSTAEGANVGPGGAVDATCTKKPRISDLPKPLPKPIVIATECRCLD